MKMPFQNRFTTMLVISFLGFFGLGILTLGGLFFNFYVPWATYDSLTSDKTWESLNVRTMSFKSLKDFQHAEKDLTEKLPQALKDGDPIPSYLLGSLYQELSNTKSAIASYEQAKKLIQESHFSGLSAIVYRHFLENLNGELTLLYFQNKQPDRALAALDEIQALDDLEKASLLKSLKNVLENKNRADYHFRLGKELQHALQLDDARQEYEQALALSHDPRLKLEAEHYLKIRMPKSLHHISPLTLYYMKAGDWNENVLKIGQVDLDHAAEFYEQAVHESPQFEWSYYHLALVHKDLGHQDKTLEYIQKARLLNPEFFLPYITLGEMAMDRGEYKEAILHYEKAFQLNSRLSSHEDNSLAANIENQLGYAYEQQDQQLKAKTHYANALKLLEQSFRSYLREEDSAYNTNDSEEFDETLEEFRQSSDDYRYAQESLERLKEEKGSSLANLQSEVSKL